ncbi:hypothetical protein QA599_01955 [Haloarculaceae archaeon H-GB1-1]|nr:hypothetical protein [Haloarculaceae archaeon H-GB1-1]
MTRRLTHLTLPHRLARPLVIWERLELLELMFSHSTALATFKPCFRGNTGLTILGLVVVDGTLECNRRHQPDVVLGALK